MNLRDYIISDRQWKRDHRLGHARHMLTKAVTEQDKQFWRDVIDANKEE